MSVEHEAHGGWSVALPENRVKCETLDAARRIAYRCAAHTRPCELIVHDAYHRVIHHELIDDHQRGPTASPPKAPKQSDVASERP